MRPWTLGKDWLCKPLQRWSLEKITPPFCPTGPFVKPEKKSDYVRRTRLHNASKVLKAVCGDSKMAHRVWAPGLRPEFDPWKPHEGRRKSTFSCMRCGTKETARAHTHTLTQVKKQCSFLKSCLAWGMWLVRAIATKLICLVNKWLLLTVLLFASFISLYFIFPAPSMLSVSQLSPNTVIDFMPFRTSSGVFQCAVPYWWGTGTPNSEGDRTVCGTEGKRHWHTAQKSWLQQAGKFRYANHLGDWTEPRRLISLPSPVGQEVADMVTNSPSLPETIRVKALKGLQPKKLGLWPGSYQL